MAYKQIFGHTAKLDRNSCGELGILYCDANTPFEPSDIQKSDLDVWVYHPEANADPELQRQGPVWEDILFLKCPHCGETNGVPKNLA